MGIQLSEAEATEAAVVRQRIKLCALITERQLTAALEAELAGYTYTAQNRRDMASLTAMFAVELAKQNREVLA